MAPPATIWQTAGRAVFLCVGAFAENSLFCRRQLFADRACDHDKYRALVRARRIEPVIARRGTAHGSGRGRYRWVAGQAIELLHWFRRLRIRWEIRRDIHEALLTLGCAVICWRRLKIYSLC